MTSVAAELGRADARGALGRDARRRGRGVRRATFGYEAVEPSPGPVGARSARAARTAHALEPFTSGPTASRAMTVRSHAPMTDRIDVRDTGRERLPPGQIITRKWPVLHYGTVPAVDLAAWRFEVTRRGRAAALAHAGTSCWRCPGARPCATCTASPAGAGTTTCSRACRSRPSSRARASSPRPRTCWSTPSRSSPPTCRWRTWTGRPTCSRSRTTASR